MAHVHLVDERSLEAIARILPIDKTINSEGLRRSLEPRLMGALESKLNLSLEVSVLASIERLDS
jgi:hypothetical protein